MRHAIRFPSPLLVFEIIFLSPDLNLLFLESLTSKLPISMG
jgi:hypothetical protein